MSILKNCVVCDTEFTAENEKGIYCSGKCRSKAQRIRDKKPILNLTNTEYIKQKTENALLKDRLEEAEKQILKLNREFQIISKYVMDFTVSAAKVTFFEEKQIQFKELIKKLESKIEEFQKQMYDRTEKNTDNLREMALYLNEITMKINAMTENDKPDFLDRLFNNDKIMAILSKVLSGTPENEKLTQISQ
jgi:hypothetical protein